MREAGGRIVLMDFGAGREVTPDKNAPHADLAGTPLYLAPELFVGRPASAASDIYSLGVLLFFLVTRKYPVNGRNLADIAMMHSQGRRLLLSDCSPDLPVQLRARGRAGARAQTGSASAERGRDDGGIA